MEKATSQDKSAAGSLSSASKKRVASIEVSQGSEEEKLNRDEHRRQQIAIQIVKLETELEHLREEPANLEGK